MSSLSAIIVTTHAPRASLSARRNSFTGSAIVSHIFPQVQKPQTSKDGNTKIVQK